MGSSGRSYWIPKRPLGSYFMWVRLRISIAFYLYIFCYFAGITCCNTCYLQDDAKKLDRGAKSRYTVWVICLELSAVLSNDLEYMIWTFGNVCDLWGKNVALWFGQLCLTYIFRKYGLPCCFIFSVVALLLFLVQFIFSIYTCKNIYFILFYFAHIVSFISEFILWW